MNSCIVYLSSRLDDYNSILPTGESRFEMACCSLRNVTSHLNLEEIEKINGCLDKGWMDANIHAMIIFMIFPLINIKYNIITDFGYRHNRHFSIINSHNFVYKSTEDFFPKK